LNLCLLNAAYCFDKFLHLCSAKLVKHINNSLDLKKKILNILKYTLFTALGVFLFWMVYKDLDFQQAWNILKNDVNYNWVFLSLFLGLLSHLSRTLRWKIALEPLGENPKTSNTFITVMVGYFMNLLLPRMGEFARCALLSKYEKIPISKLLGTVVTERIIDMIMLLLATMLVILLEFDKILSFSSQNPEVLDKLTKIATSPILWVGLFIAIAAFVGYIIYSRKKGNKNKIMEIIDGFVDGIRSILSMKRYMAYIAHSFFIWTMYFLMLYVVFFSFDFTKILTPLAGLTTFVFASFGMVAPVQGGIGAWHFMAEKALELYGVESSLGKTFALLAHTSTNALIVLVGAICLIILPIVNRNYTPKSK
jgi:glycosyltransferase 2 family protein